MTGAAQARAAPVDSLRGAVCLVTGASGFIGGHLTRRLVAEGASVRCFVRASSDISLLERLDVEIACGDLTAPDSLARAASGCRYAFHCGARVSDWGTVGEIARVNVQGTRNVLEACAGASVQRVIHLSTTDVYGYPGGAAIDEDYAAVRFRNWYAQTKLAAEAEVRGVATAHALDAVILRPATVYGPGSADVVGEIARAMRAGHMLLVGGGRAVAGLCYVENLVDAVVLASQHTAAAGNAFNVCDGLKVSWKQFTDDLAAGLGCAPARWSMPYRLANAVGFSLEHGYRLLRRATGLTMAPLLSRQAVQVLGIDQDFSNRKAREMLGWEPRVDYATGVEATLDWLRTEYLARRDRPAGGFAGG